MNKIYKILFFCTLTAGTMISISSSSWLGAWMGLEINLISFIPLISNTKNIFSTESSMKYFIVQALASSVLLFSILMFMYNYQTSNLIKESIYTLINSSLLTKMGAAPFHYWFPEVLSKLNWNQSMILLTWQKIAPLMIISYNMKPSTFTFFVIASSVTIGSLVGLNQTSLQKILAYSSINHMGWMLSIASIMENIWFVYLVIYSMITASIILILKPFNIFHTKQLFFFLNNKPTLKFSFLINFLSLGGLPPFLGFFPKWMIIQNLILENMMLTTFIMIIFTLITLFFYLRITFSILSMSYNEINWNQNNKINNKSIYLTTFISLTGLIVITMMSNIQ